MSFDAMKINMATPIMMNILNRRRATFVRLNCFKWSGMMNGLFASRGGNPKNRETSASTMSTMAITTYVMIAVVMRGLKSNLSLLLFAPWIIILPKDFKGTANEIRSINYFCKEVEEHPLFENLLRCEKDKHDDTEYDTQT